MKKTSIFLIFGLLVSCAQIQQSSTGLELTQVTETVYAAIGATEAPSLENRGHNNNLSVILTADGVVVVNGGDNYQLAADLHTSIKQLTNLPVIWVINENGQGHAFLGNCYWRQQGIPIIAHEAAIHEIESNGTATLDNMIRRNGPQLAVNTCVALPEHAFSGQYQLPIPARQIMLLTFGDAHSPGDISVWLPDEQVLITGDIAFHERLPGVFPDTHVRSWIASFDKMTALPANIIVPGHGHPTGWADIRATTRDYLQYLVDQSESILNNDGDLSAAYQIDQSAYSHLNTFTELAVKNAGRIFQQIELEYFE